MLLHLQLLNNLAPLVSLLLQAVKIEVELAEDGLDVLKVLPHRQHVDRQVGEEELAQDLAGRRRNGLQAVQDGTITEERIDESVERIVKVKLQMQ